MILQRLDIAEALSTEPSPPEMHYRACQRARAAAHRRTYGDEDPAEPVLAYRSL